MIYLASSNYLLHYSRTSNCGTKCRLTPGVRWLRFERVTQLQKFEFNTSSGDANYVKRTEFLFSKGQNFARCPNESIPLSVRIYRCLENRNLKAILRTIRFLYDCRPGAWKQIVKPQLLFAIPMTNTEIWHSGACLVDHIFTWTIVGISCDFISHISCKFRPLSTWGDCLIQFIESLNVGLLY